MKKKFGFTMAELLVSLFIVMVIATAMAPIVGPKKTTPNKQRIAHGVFECFYDDDGTLYAFRSDSSGSSQWKPNNGVCEFAPPKANSYVVTIKGAGGDGSGLDENGNPILDFAYYAKDQMEPKKGLLHTDNRFSTDLRSAPPSIQQFYEDLTKPTLSGGIGHQQILKVMYSIQGASPGPGRPYDKDGSAQQNSSGETTGHASIHKDGGLGGTIAGGWIQAVLDKNSVITQEVSDPNGWNFARICVGTQSGEKIINNKCLTMHAAGAGEKATSDPNQKPAPGYNGWGEYKDADGNSTVEACRGAGADCHWWVDTNGLGQHSAVCPYCDTKGGEYGELTRPLDDRVPKYFGYEYSTPKIWFTYGFKGADGETVTKVYSDLQGKQLRLEPAARYIDNQKRITYSKLYSIEDNQQKEILNARSGEQGKNPLNGKPFGVDWQEKLVDNNMDVFPFKDHRTGKDAILAPKSINETITYQSYGLSSLISQKHAHIGYGGSGSYPLIYNETAAAINKILYSENPFHPVLDENKEVVLNGEKSRNQNFAINVGVDPNCYESLEHIPQKMANTANHTKSDGSPQYFCPAQRGGGGAIIISW